MPRLTAPVVPEGALARLPQPVLAGPGFVLRPWVTADAPAVAAAFDDPGIRQWHARSLSLAEATTWVERWPAQWKAERAASWAITGDRMDGQAEEAASLAIAGNRLVEETTARAIVGDRLVEQAEEAAARVIVGNRLVEQAEEAAARVIAGNRLVEPAGPRSHDHDRLLGLVGQPTGSPPQPAAAEVKGQVGLRAVDLDEGTAAISYWVLPEARGRRLATRALTVLSRWAFEVVGLHRLELNHSTLNPASCRVAERAGYAAEGTQRGAALHADGWHDMHSHARIATDPALDVSTEID